MVVVVELKGLLRTRKSHKFGLHSLHDTNNGCIECSSSHKLALVSVSTTGRGDTKKEYNNNGDRDEDSAQ